VSLGEALDRTLRLMRDEVKSDVGDEILLQALTSTTVALIADKNNISCHSAQTAFVTAAILMARSGHRVHVLAPNVPLIGPQPPLGIGRMVEQLVQTGTNMLPGVEFSTAIPSDEIDLVIALGNSPVAISGRRTIRLNAEPWAGIVAPETDLTPWGGDWWPIGSMVAAALGAGEAFKVTMQKLQPFAPNQERMNTLFAYTEKIRFTIAPLGTPYARELGLFDLISGGAITSTALYVLSRIPGVSGRGRIVESDTLAISNLNRYPLMLRSHTELFKADDLVALFTGTGLKLAAVAMRYEPITVKKIGPLAPSVLIGVDHIPTRWLVQQAGPAWLGIGATTHWSAMASFHEEDASCAQCLHPTDDPNDAPIPTVAFVSFWAGLLTASYFLRHVAGETIQLGEQHIYLTPLRPESPVRGVVPFRRGCPTCATSSKASASIP
jgi:hypothetical protein